MLQFDEKERQILKSSLKKLTSADSTVDLEILLDILEKGVIILQFRA